MMKKVPQIIAVLLCCIASSFTASAKDLFAEVKKLPDTESVHVNGFMMSIARSAVKMSAGKDAGQALEVLKGIKSMDIIECDQSSSIPTTRNLARKIIEAEGYQVAFENMENNETVVIYCQPSNNKSDAGKLKNVIIEVCEPKEYSIIVIKGTINPETFTPSAIK